MAILDSTAFAAIPVYLLVTSGFLMAFLITWIIIPSIVYIARLKGLCAIPNGRTSHTGHIPTLGGIAVFTGLIISTVIFGGTFFAFELKYIIAGLIIVFFLGIKDDILIIDPVKKILGQILASALIAVFADIRITSMYGLFGIEQLSYISSVLLTIFVFIVIINSFNLTDGIDGLASGVGILAALVFGIWFWNTGNIGYAILSFSFVGTLTAFFRFNVFGKENKIFLGDTGSQLTGFTVGILTFRFLQLNAIIQGTNYIESAPAFVFGILIIPLFDAIRLFVLRISRGRSPFKADRQHVHHHLLKLVHSHLGATLTIMCINLIFIILSFLLRSIGIIWLTGINLGLAGMMTYFLVALAEKKTRRVNNKFYIHDFCHEIKNKETTASEKIPARDVVLNPLEKVNSDMN